MQERLTKLATQIVATLATKNADYGDAFRKRGLPGILVRLEDKVGRLDRLVWQGNEPRTDEPARDAWLDIAGYALLALLLTDEANEAAAPPPRVVAPVYPVQSAMPGVLADGQEWEFPKRPGTPGAAAR